MEASASNDSWEDEANSDRAASSDESEQASNNSNNNSECEEEEEDEDEEEKEIGESGTSGLKICEDIPSQEPDEENEELEAQDTSTEDKFISEEAEEEEEKNDNDKNEFEEEEDEDEDDDEEEEENNNNIEDETTEKDNEESLIDDDNETNLLDKSDETKDENKGLSSEEMVSSPPAVEAAAVEEEQDDEDEEDSEREDEFSVEKGALDAPLEEQEGNMAEKTAEEESKHLSPRVTIECKSPVREVVDCHRNSSPEFGVECERTVIEDKVKISPIEHRLTEKRVVKIRDSGSLPQASLSEEHVELDYDEEDMEEPSTRTVSLEAKTDKDDKDDGEWDEERKVRNLILFV